MNAAAAHEDVGDLIEITREVLPGPERRIPCFRDRTDAGRKLAAMLVGTAPESVVIVGIASGGAVVAAEVALRLGAPLSWLRSQGSSTRVTPVG
jgi:adenine/guanine phosphoribosyltransferase-like PRPP-binding protein